MIEMADIEKARKMLLKANEGAPMYVTFMGPRHLELEARLDEAINKKA